jgi:hypothetical protein
MTDDMNARIRRATGRQVDAPPEPTAPDDPSDDAEPTIDRPHAAINAAIRAARDSRVTRHTVKPQEAQE